MSKPVIVSGMRATGKMHIGHLVGALENWVALQDRYQCFFFVADYHALLSEFQDTSRLAPYAMDMVRDWLAAGLNPDTCVIFKQSDVPQHAELFALLASFVPVGWLERSPTYKEQVQNLEGKEVANYGFFGYPVLQTADILLYKGQYVPVGEDQVSHLEISREITRRFNQFYPGVFPEPRPLLTQIPKLLGTDNRKMSKSYGNAINLESELPEIVKTAVTMVTDPKRARLKDPGHPDECNVYSYYKVFGAVQAAEARDWCENARRGCMDCKKTVAEHIDRYIAPIRERRKRFSDERILEILRQGAEKARQVAGATIAEVKSKLNL